jgi:hypothetical protein
MFLYQHSIYFDAREALICCSYLLKHEKCAKYRGLMLSVMNICDYFILTVLDINIIIVNVVQKILHVGT